jgi:hypothetical protein
VITEYAAQCRWPSLPEPFATALRQAVAYIFQEVDPVGIVATGTIIRGAAHANSDLDLYVIHLASHRRRIQRRFSGVPAEIFINPPSAVRGYFDDEDRDGRRLTAHMLATGVVIFSTGTVVDELRAEATQWLVKDTPISAFERVSMRYTIASRLEDALDVLATDDVTAAMLLAETVLAMLEFICKADDGQFPAERTSWRTWERSTPRSRSLLRSFFERSTYPNAHVSRCRLPIIRSALAAFFRGIPGLDRCRASIHRRIKGWRVHMQGQSLAASRPSYCSGGG